MGLTDVNLSCPHCRRQYTMKVDLERLKRVNTRATCGRCGNSFDVGSRLTAGLQAPPMPAVPPGLHAPRTAQGPAPSRPQVAPLDVKAPPTAVPSNASAADLEDIAQMAREFADAASRFTPVNARRPSFAAPGTEPTSTSPAPSSPTTTTTAARDPEPATNPRLAPAHAVHPAALADAAHGPIETTPARAPEPEPAAPTLATPAVPVEEEAAEDEVSVSWIDLADPGLELLVAPASPSADALDRLLTL